jgi:hypothetical protein
MKEAPAQWIGPAYLSGYTRLHEEEIIYRQAQ